MRFAIYAFLILCIMAVALATPAKKQKQANACVKDCGENNYTPICGETKDKSKARKITFGNNCVMENYNCQHSDEQFEFKAVGECGGNVSVLLS